MSQNDYHETYVCYDFCKMRPVSSNLIRLDPKSI